MEDDFETVLDPICTKDPSRNVEKRREKSRDAARSRRSKEAEVFLDLCNLVPLTHQQTSTMDKASIMRLAISHLKIRTFVGKNKCFKSTPKKVDGNLDLVCCKSLQGFLMMLGPQGDLIYVSEAVHKHLGISQLEMMGNTIYDYSHPCDHDEIQEILNRRPAEASDKEDGGLRRIAFTLRFKCALSQKGRNVNLKSSAYKVMHVHGTFTSTVKDDNEPYLLLLAEPIPHPLNNDIRLNSLSCLTRHAVDLSFVYCDESVEELLGYQLEDVKQHSLYEYFHASDGETLNKAFKDLFTKGQVHVPPFRFLVKGGGYVWVQTEATLIYHSKTEKPQSVVCVHHVLSERQDGLVVLSDVQLPVSGPRKCQLNHAKCQDGGRHSGMVGGICGLQGARQQASVWHCPSVITSQGQDSADYVTSDAEQVNSNADEIYIPFANDSFDEDAKFLQELCEELESFPGSAEVILGKSDPVFSDDICFPTFNSKDGEEQQLEAPQTPNLELLADEVRCSGGSGRDNTGEYEASDNCALDMRAPFFPMTDDANLLFGAPVRLLGDGPGKNYKVMEGNTETIFSFVEPDTSSESSQVPLNILRQQTMNRINHEFAGFLNDGNVMPKIRLAIHTNKLETGPPSSAVGSVARWGKNLAPLLEEVDKEDDLSSVESSSMYMDTTKTLECTSMKRKASAALPLGPPAFKKRMFEEETDSEHESDSSETESWSSLDLAMPPVVTSRYQNEEDIPGSVVLKDLLSKGHHENYDLEHYSHSVKAKSPKIVNTRTTLRGLLTSPLSPSPSTASPAFTLITKQPLAKAPQRPLSLNLQQTVLKTVGVNGRTVIDSANGQAGMVTLQAVGGGHPVVISQDVLLALLKSVTQGNGETQWVSQ